MAISTRPVTAEELLDMPDDGMRHELIAGELRTMTPTGAEHGGIVAALTEMLGGYVRSRRLGRVLTGESGFLLGRDPDTVRAPDLAFISRERAAAAGRVRDYWPGAPDLAIEVVSPNDRYTDVDAKVAMWLAHGASLVLVVNPRRQVVSVHRSPDQSRILTTTDTFADDEVVPGWQLPVAAIFEDALASDDERAES